MFRLYGLFSLIITSSVFLIMLNPMSSTASADNNSVTANQNLFLVPVDTLQGYPWCEGFNSPTFPPIGWVLSGGGEYYWLRDGIISGFGLGTGSAYYNCWNAPNGYVGNLITFIFTATFNTSDSLEYDYSYQPYPCVPPYSQDSLIILSSTNGGATWISLARYGPEELQTYDCQMPRLWAIKRLNLPLGTNRIDFQGKSAFGNDIYIDSICVKHPVTVQPISHNIPDKYYLSQNYPNPFNPSTTITYELPVPGFVKLAVYDISGKTVRILVNELRPAGVFEVKFDASELSSGVYFYKIQSGSFNETRKMLIIK